MSVKVDNAITWLEQVVKGNLYDKETTEAIKIVLEEIDRLEFEVIGL